jgi:hypothetical protein
VQLLSEIVFYYVHYIAKREKSQGDFQNFKQETAGKNPPLAALCPAVPPRAVRAAPRVDKGTPRADRPLWGDFSALDGAFFIRCKKSSIFL